MVIFQGCSIHLNPTFLFYMCFLSGKTMKRIEKQVCWFLVRLTKVLDWYLHLVDFTTSSRQKTDSITKSIRDLSRGKLWKFWAWKLHSFYANYPSGVLNLVVLSGFGVTMFIIIAIISVEYDTLTFPQLLYKFLQRLTTYILVAYMKRFIFQKRDCLTGWATGDRQSVRGDASNQQNTLSRNIPRYDFDRVG